MIAQSGVAGKAGTVARAFNGGGKTDWYLPSSDELVLMYRNKGIVGGLDTDPYWSSTEGLKNGAILFAPNLNGMIGALKTAAPSVRPIRAFGQSCAAGGVCAVGDVGPGGGRVFHVAPNNFASGAPCGSACKYLEAAPVGWIAAATPAGQVNCVGVGTTSVDPKCVWSGDEVAQIGSTGRAIGAGYANTSAMIAQSGVAGKAGTVARAFNGGGKTDWYLPSTEELVSLYVNKGVIGGLAPGYYWSSSELRGNEAFNLNFGAMDRDFKPRKSNSYYVRPVRAF